MGVSASLIPPIASIYLDEQGMTLRREGLLFELGSSIAQANQIKVDYQVINRTNVDNALLNHTVDFVCYVHEDWLVASKEQVVFSKPFLHDKNILVSLASFKPTIAEIDDLSGLSVGLITGYMYPELTKDIDAKRISPIYHQREANLFMGLFNNKNMNLVLLKDTTVSHFMNTMPNVVGDKKLKYHPVSFDGKLVSCAVPKAQKKTIKIVNKGIERFILKYPISEK